MIPESLTYMLRNSRALQPGKDGSSTLEPRRIYTYPRNLALISGLLAQKFVAEQIEVVMSPEGRCEKLIPGVVQYLMTATSRELYIIDAEKMASGHYFIHPDNRQFVATRRVLIIDDVCMVGSNIRRVIEAVRQVDGHVAGVGVVCDTVGRFEDTFDDVPCRHALLSLAPQMA